MTYNDFALFISLVCLAGFFYLAINAVYKVTVTKKPTASINPLTNELPVAERVQMIHLPKQAPRNSHWARHTFERPRKKVRR